MGLVGRGDLHICALRGVDGGAPQVSDFCVNAPGIGDLDGRAWPTRVAQTANQALSVIAGLFLMYLAFWGVLSRSEPPVVR
jgi:hypothetical protein